MDDRLTTQEFALQLPRYLEAYQGTRYFRGCADLENAISRKAEQTGCLEKDDLAKIADWGGNQHGVKQRMMAANTDEAIRCATRAAITNLSDAIAALSALFPIKEWGLTYESKTLRFIRPQDYPALDSILKENVTTSYTKLISICREIQQEAPAGGPRSGGSWWIADIEMALFMFSKLGGKLLLG